MMLHHVVNAMNSEAMGTSQSVPALCRELAALGHEVVLHTLAPSYALIADGYRIAEYRAWPFVTQLGISPAMKSALRFAAGRAQILHSHLLWKMPNIYPGRAIVGTNCRMVVSPRGCLAPWALAYHAGRKRLMWLAGQKYNLERASCIHVTADQELGYVRDLGLRAPIALIPNGIYVRDLTTFPKRPLPRRRLLFLSRVHVKKGVDILLHAWGNVQKRFGDWELCIVGPDDGGHLPQMRRLAETLRLERVEFTGFIPERDKPRTFRDSDLFILLTHTENWGMAVAEALAHGVPAIVSKGAPWSELHNRGCGWWIENSVESATESLTEALALSPAELERRGRLGHDWMRADYSWQTVGSMMSKVYEWLVGGGAPPQWVQL